MLPHSAFCVFSGRPRPYIIIIWFFQFNKEAGRVIEDFKLRVVYIPANPPSPVPEGSEEGNSPMASLNEIGSQTASLFDDVRSIIQFPHFVFQIFNSQELHCN